LHGAREVNASFVEHRFDGFRYGRVANVIRMEIVRRALKRWGTRRTAIRLRELADIDVRAMLIAAVNAGWTDWAKRGGQSVS